MSNNTVEQTRRTRLLLTLWELSLTGEEIKRGAITKKACKKGERSGDYQPFMDELIQKGVVAIDKKTITLSDAKLKSLLVDALSNSSFEFSSPLSVGKANALLDLVRGAGTAIAASPQKSEAIDSYDGFKLIALEVYEQLNKDYNLDNLVPIYRIRRTIGDRVSRSNFDEWFSEMQVHDVVQLIGGEMPELTPDKAEDSIKTALGGIRYYAKRL